MPPGTNGGVSAVGTAAGFAGAAVMALTAVAVAPFCYGTEESILREDGHSGWGWGWREKLGLVVAVTVWGGLGSLLDSALGGWFQQSVVDTRTGKVVEGAGGKRVLVKEARVVMVQQEEKRSDEKPGRRVESGWGVLDNNAVNVLMVTIMSVGGMMVAGWYWDIPLNSVLDVY